jgi:pimeloyl-ACP methyl ester carboxylesterase
MVSTKEYTSSFVTSKDGTKIHYREIGSGKGLVLVHGAMQYSDNFMPLAKLLANDFTVYIPDRSGHGLSEMHKSSSLIAESEDMKAILKRTNAPYIFGLSSGALVVLQTVIQNSNLEKIALYEPPLPFDSTPDYINRQKMEQKYHRAIAKQNYGKAFISILKGTGDRGSLMKNLPGFITVPLMNIVIHFEAKKEFREDDVSLKSLINTMQNDLSLVYQSNKIIDKIEKINGDILLLGGEKSQAYLKDALDRVSAALPNAIKVELPKVGHIAADKHGKPELVARELKRFFKNSNN